MSCMFKMVSDNERKIVVITVLNLLLTTVSIALQLHTFIAVQLFLKYQEIKQHLMLAIEDKNRALYRYKLLRNRFLRKKRRQWKNADRIGIWWQNIWKGNLPEEEWLVNFRMSREDFSDLLQKVKLYISPNPNSFRPDAVSAAKKLAMTLYYLKGQGSLRTTGDRFGVAPSTLSLVIRQVCQTIVKVLSSKVIRFPTSEHELRELIARFENKFGFPQVVGCLDCTHIPIKQPVENSQDYFCHEMRYSLNVQAVCDERGLFIDFDCSWPGSAHDTNVFANSAISKLFTEKTLPNVDRTLLQGDIAVPPLLIGDSAYPLLPNLMKEYEACYSNEQALFNEMLRSVRSQIECAFGRLKTRWCILNRPMDFALEVVPTIVYACFILHNFCESRELEQNPESVHNQIIEERQNQSCQHHTAIEAVNKLYANYGSDGTKVRENLAKYFGQFLMQE